MADAVKDAVRQKLVAILAEQAVLEPDDVRMDATPEELGIDSLGMVEAVFAIEAAFDIQVPFNANDPGSSELDIGTVETMVRGVEALIAARAAGPV